MAVINLRAVPDDLYEAVKVQSKSEDKRMKHWILEAIQTKLKTSDPSRRWTEKEKV